MPLTAAAVEDVPQSFAHAKGRASVVYQHATDVTTSVIDLLQQCQTYVL